MEKLREKARSLPEKPGVYLMRDKAGEIIYVGKARVLRNRVSSYFGSLTNQHPKVRRMVEQIETFDYIVTDSEMEALVLENSQIKLYKPKYNILLKDDKSYPYIKVTVGEAYPRILFTRKRLQDGARYFGPYSGDVKGLIATVCKAFMLPVCKREFPRDIGKGRPCLNHFIGQCCAPCTGEVAPEQYRAVMDEVLLFLSGRYEKAAESLAARMEAAAEAEEFEQAAKLRDQLRALRLLGERQKVVAGPGVDQDVVGFAEDGVRACFQVFFVRGGRIVNRESFVVGMETVENPPAAMSQFLTRLYGIKEDVPRRILVSVMPEDGVLISEYLAGKRGSAVELRVPQRGELRKLTNMVVQNAAETLAQLAIREEKQAKSLGELQELLGLPAPPARIEALDISHTAGGAPVAALILFQNGQPQKSGYKRYKIKSVDGPDDYESMREVVWRRFSRYKDGDEGFSELPDLLLLDGGRGQLSAVLGVLRELGVSVPAAGMVKDEHHRTRALVLESGEVGLPVTSRAFVLVARIQEEVHRFAVEYHRSLRGRKAVKSALSDIPGVGDVRVAALLRHFKTREAIAGATLEELTAVKGMNRPAAMAVLRYFGKGD